MTYDEMLSFKGGDISLYQELIEKRQKLKKQIRILSNRIFDEDDSISVFVGDLSEKDSELLKKHTAMREEMIAKREYKKKLLDKVIDQISSMQIKK